MKAIILRAWRWTRLQPITNTMPKPMIKIFWKSIIEHNLEHIYKFIDEIIVVVKYKKEYIIEHLWDDYNWVKITYIEQWDNKWTAWALMDIELWDIGDDILILNWDSIFEEKDLKDIINYDWYGALVKEVLDPSKYGIFSVNSEQYAIEIVEKPDKYIWNLANLWVYKFNSNIINLAKNTPVSKRWEYEITDTLNMFIKDYKFKLFTIKWDFIDVWYPWDILSANNHFLDNLDRSTIKWTVEDSVYIKWNIILWENSILKSWTYIEWNVYIWANTSIWPNTYLRGGAVIWDNCHIWNRVEIKNTSIWDNSNVAHLSYIWDSIIWNNVNIWWWFITANLRHDWDSVKSIVKWELIDTKLRKLWVIIWDSVKIGINTATYPGRVIDDGRFTMPGEIIK